MRAAAGEEGRGDGCPSCPGAGVNWCAVATGLHVLAVSILTMHTIARARDTWTRCTCKIYLQTREQTIIKFADAYLLPRKV